MYGLMDKLHILGWYAVIFAPLVLSWSLYALSWQFIGYQLPFGLLTGALLVLAILVSLGTVFLFYVLAN